MFKNYFKTALRNLRKDRLNTATNLIGLAIGIACCILILIFVNNELSFDQFHKNSDRIYRAWVKENYKSGQQFFNTVTPYPLGSALENEIPEIQSVVQISLFNWQVVSDSKKNPTTVHMVGKDFFDVFSFKTISGNTSKVFDDVKNIVLTEEMALRHFGSTDVIGKDVVFDLDNEENIFSVKAVVENPPTNSSIRFNMLISDLNKTTLLGGIELENWFNINPETYVLLKEESSLANTEPKLKVISKKYVGMPEGDTYTIGLQPLTDIHLNPDYPIGIAPVTDPKYAYILGGIALLILALACINFIMLSISKSVGRAKEVGVRKSIGALKSQIVQQFLSEAILTVFLALIIGLVLARIFLPYFNDLANKELSMSFTPFLIGVALSMVVIIGIVAGSYPALVVSNFRAASILKGGNTGVSSKNNLRKILIGFQFVLSIGLIASTFIMTKQLNFIKNKNLGFDKEQLVSVQLQVPEGRMTSTINKGMETSKLFKDKLNGLPEIKNVAASSHTFSPGGWTEIGFTDLDGKYNEFNLNIVSSEYLSTMDMKLVSGRDFQEGNASDQRRAVIVNEAFAKKYNIQNLKGTKISDSNFGDHEIIGIVKDFNYTSLHGEIEPLVLSLNPSLFFVGNVDINIYSSPTPKLLVRLKPNAVQDGISEIKQVWTEISGDSPFDYQFIDQQLDALYEQEQNLGTIVGITSLFAILVGGLGLFALASLNIQNRMKELSIRKILGASNGTTLFLIAKEYIIMIVITLLIASPITWFIMSDWLSTFTYRIDITVIVFLLAGIVATVTAVLSISYHSYRAIKTEPIEYLRYE
ncbi:MAG: hypothetical protein CMC76_07455 [Flavobacteriaceae bacterium]|nr:hypothetical protein [Flavobacteriaceae bacterium]